MARGTFTRGDLPTLADGTDTARLFADLQEVLATYNQARDGLRSLLTYKVTAAREYVLQTTAGMEFEQASEFGEPVGGRVPMDHLNLGFQFGWYDLAGRFTWQFLADATSAQVDSFANGAMEADSKLVFKQVMGALFDNVKRTNKEGDNVQPLYNADGTVPPEYQGETFDGTHNHYFTTGDANPMDSADVDSLTMAVTEHGFGTGDSTTGRLILFASKDEADIMRGFRVASGASFDFIPSDLAPPYLTTDTLVGEKPPSTFGGVKIIGSYGSALVSESHLIPSGYVLAAVSNGSNSAYNPVGFREHPTATLRGLRLVKGATPDYPIIDSFYTRGVGTGVRLRGAAAVLQVTSGSYTVPSAFDL